MVDSPQVAGSHPPAVGAQVALLGLDQLELRCRIRVGGVANLQHLVLWRRVQIAPSEEQRAETPTRREALDELAIQTQALELGY